MIPFVVGPDSLWMAEVSGGTLFVKVGLIMATAALVTRTLGHASAAVRAHVWAVGFVALLAMPVASLLLPSWHPPATSHELETGVTPFVAAPVEVPRSNPTEVRLDESSANVPTPGHLLGISLLLAWVSVAAVLILRLVVHYALAFKLCRRGITGSARLTQLAMKCASEVGLRRAPRLLLHKTVALPASLGWPRPTILLPLDAESWSTERMSAVLRHESAHLVRRDYVMQLVVELGKALHWINPFVHLAASRIDVERERACDDAALRAGHSPQGYAGCLLELARGAIGSQSRVALLAVTGRSGLAERIRGIIDGNRDRSPAPIRFVWATAIIAMVLVVPIATFQAVSQDRPTVEQLIVQLRSGDALLARRAAWQLGEREDPQAVSALLEQLRAGTADGRLVAVWALGEIKDPMAIEGLKQTLMDEDPHVREMAALALGELERDDAIDALVTAANDDATMRSAVAWALGEIDTDQSWQIRRELTGVSGTREDDNEEVWAGSLTRFGTTPLRTDVPALLAQLRSDNRAERVSAAWNLGALGDERGVDGLLTALRDPEPDVRAMAVWALDEINPSRQ